MSPKLTPQQARSAIWASASRPVMRVIIVALEFNHLFQFISHTPSFEWPFSVLQQCSADDHVFVVTNLQDIAQYHEILVKSAHNVRSTCGFDHVSAHNGCYDCCDFLVILNACPREEKYLSI